MKNNVLLNINNIISKCKSIVESYNVHNIYSLENIFIAITQIRKLLIELRDYIINNTFDNQDDEICFFKIQKPEILSKLLFFNRIYQIETKCSNIDDTISISCLNKELDDIISFFEHNIDFYHYYRSNSNIFDEYYFVRGKEDVRLCDDNH